MHATKCTLMLRALCGNILMNKLLELNAVDKETKGTVIAVKRQWWLKVNTKPLRTHALDGAVFPHVIKVKYTLNGQEYIRRKWIKAGSAVPGLGSSVTLIYSEDKPSKARIQ